MEHAIQRFLFLSFMSMTISYAAADLQNPDFEIPPTNLPSNATSQIVLLTQANTIPGWSFNGTVSYVSGNGSSPARANGHAVQLGESGRINQTFTAPDDFFNYFLSFDVAAQNEGCAHNRTAVRISIYERSDLQISRVFFLQRNLSRNLWQRHALFAGQLLGRDSIDIEIESVDMNSTCWPVVDAFAVSRNGVVDVPQNGNMLSNGDFEVGPPFLNFSEGIILNEDEDIFRSPLQGWSVLGTIKYIDSQHYRVPQGEAAIELLSGALSGIHKNLDLPARSTHTLSFTMGDANDSCIGDFLVYVNTVGGERNFTMRSNGTGSFFSHSMTFRSEFAGETFIRFFSLSEMRSSHGVLCGPVLDNILLSGSCGRRVGLFDGILGFSLFLALEILFTLEL